MAPPRRSNPLALAVLACLQERPMHPYEVAQTLRVRAKHESVKLNYGSLYSVVESLEKRGLIHATETIRDGRRPERTVYEVTDSGRREFDDWLTDLVARPAKEYLQFEAALSFIGGLTPEDALVALQERCTALQFWMTAMRAVLQEMEASGLPRIHGLEAEYMITLYEAELDWVRLLVKDIESGSLDGLDQWHEWHGRSSRPRFPPEALLADEFPTAPSS
ncbi:MAG TPA: PadR family transcriptional regulator [Actinomycetota bacterium]|nr:PadR family transcriptional regulator [Actinomycetota bacterium]